MDLGKIVNGEFGWRNFSNVYPIGRTDETKVAVETAVAVTEETKQLVQDMNHKLEP